MKKEIFLCAINNVLSGSCDQDCQFCTQSVRYRANIERYNYKSIDKIVQEALIAKSYGALGYCLVTAGVGLDDKKTEFIAKVARAIKSEIEGLNLMLVMVWLQLNSLEFFKRVEWIVITTIWRVQKLIMRRFVQRTVGKSDIKPV